MKALIMGIAGALAFGASPALAQDAAVEAPVYQFVDAFNKGDTAAAAATHADDAHITDEFAPHFWGGHHVIERWAADYAKDAEAKGITEPRVELGKVTRELVEGDAAYLVVPSVYTYKQHSVAMSETAQMTFALKKQSDSWKIVAWTWTGPNATPVK